MIHAKVKDIYKNYLLRMTEKTYLFSHIKKIKLILKPLQKSCKNQQDVFLQDDFLSLAA